MGTPMDTEIEVTALGFRARPSARQRLESYPRRMVWDDREYTFVDGIRLLVQKGQELVRLFDMSDGHNTYRLRQDGSDHWRLVGMRAGV